jgi:DHA1 family bicyclomycin/chloramphenicol resistance-like MFS transporter
MGGTLLLPLIALLQFESLWPLMVPLFLCMAALALVVPNSSACALAGQGHQAGVASALMGTLQFAIAGVVSALVGALHDGTALPMALMIALCGMGAAGMAFMARRVGSGSLG